MHIVRIMTLVVIAVFLTGCGDNSQGSAALRDIESYIEQAPDSALTALRSIDAERLCSRHLRARHALLHSIALDKNYIDLTTDSIISPAVSYFSRKGSPDDRFRTLYYLGRIRQNAGQSEEAMELFVKASALEDKVTDMAAIARCWSVMGLLYSRLYDFEKAVWSYQKSSGLFLEAGNINSYVNDCLKTADAWWCLGEYDKSLIYIKTVESKIDKVSVNTVSRYFSERLSTECKLLSSDDIFNTIEDYISSVPSSYIDWLGVSDSYYIIGEYDHSLNALKKYCEINAGYDRNAGYHAMASRIYEALEEYEESSYHNSQYIHLTDSLDMVILSEDTKFIQERYEKDMSILQSKNKNLAYAIATMILVVFLTVSILYAIRSNRNRKALHNLFVTAAGEKEALENMMRSMQLIDFDMLALISERITLLNDIVLHHRLPGSKNARIIEKKLQALLNDTKEYLSTVGIFYSIRNSSFVSYLKSKGLLTWEIGYCCLYIMGYNAKEISGIMNNSQVYKISSEIRRKLGYNDGKLRFESILKSLYDKHKP